MVLTSSKALISLSQVDLILSFILFIVENLVPINNNLVHVIILVTSTMSVFLSLMEIYVISRKEYWQLLGATIVRLGPMVGLSIFWMICSRR